jgi:hypothetical protein
VTQEWFRDPAWDEAGQAEFERRLNRARPQTRPQYLRIKALALRDAGRDDPAIHLLQRVITEHPDAWPEVNFALGLLGDLARTHGWDHEAERHYRDLLDSGRSLSGTTGMVHVSLAEILIDRDNETSTKEAVALLAAWAARPGGKFNNDLFRWNLAALRTAEQTGDRESRRNHAKTALALIDGGPQLPKHPDVGRVHTDDATLHRLRDIAKSA